MPPRTEPCPSPGFWPSKAAQAPCSWPQVLVSTPTPPPGPSPGSHFLIWVYHTGRKKRNFSLSAISGKGSPQAPGASRHPRVWHTCCLRPRPHLPPAPTPTRPTQPERSPDTSRPLAWLGESSEEAQAAGWRPWGRRGSGGREGGPWGMRVGHRTEAPAAGDSRGKEGKKGFGFIGVQSPDVKEWNAKFPWGGGSWGAKAPLGGDLVVPPELGAGRARQRGAHQHRVKE